jgi:hypothetical protein
MVGWMRRNGEEYGWLDVKEWGKYGWLDVKEWGRIWLTGCEGMGENMVG